MEQNQFRIGGKGSCLNPPAEFYVLASAGEFCKDIARKLGKNPETVRYWSRHLRVQLADGRPDMVRGEGRRALVELNAGRPLSDPKSKYFLFRYQKKGAYKRDIPWEMTFSEWLQIWAESGMWDLRGGRKGAYCMARNGDVGPYKVGNVRIIPFEQNAAERWTNNGGRRFKVSAN